MAIPKLKVTKRGARELSGPGEVIITKVGFGHNYETDMERASLSGVTSIASFQPTVTQEGDYQIIDVTFDNENTGKAQYSNTFIKTIAIIAKKGASGEEFILYGGSDLQGVHVQPNSFGAPHQLLQFIFKVRLSGDANITVQASELPGLATADSVNRVQDTVNQFKTGSVSDLARLINIENLGALFGKIVKTNNDVDNLSTPGIYQYTTNMSPKGISSSYGFILVFSNGIGSPGQNGHFTWQLFVGTNGRMWVRKRINTEAWNVTDVANGNVLTALLRKIGLDEWGATIAINTCPSGTNFGTFLASNAVPIGFNIVKDNNAPAKTVYVWKQSNTIASCFAMADNGSFLTATLNSGRLSEWRDLSQPQAPLVSTGQFATYLRSNAVPVGSVPVKDSVSGAFGTVTKIDNNNVFFTGAMRKQGRTYQVAFAIVDGIVPSAFTEWALT
nr:MAG TPA: hypothetical protein [Caudoviricetes sp.]